MHPGNWADRMSDVPGQPRVSRVDTTDPSVAFLEFRPVGNVRENGGSSVMTVRRILTGNRGEYLRVVGIHSDG